MTLRCEFCGNADVEKVLEDPPYTVDHWQCPLCCSTYVLALYPKDEEVVTVQERVDIIIARDIPSERKLQDLWFLFGNNGMAHTRDNHMYIQRLVEGRPEEAKWHTPTRGCLEAVARVTLE